MGGTRVTIFQSAHIQKHQPKIENGLKVVNETVRPTERINHDAPTAERRVVPREVAAMIEEDLLVPREGDREVKVLSVRWAAKNGSRLSKSAMVAQPQSIALDFVRQNVNQLEPHQTEFSKMNRKRL